MFTVSCLPIDCENTQSTNDEMMGGLLKEGLKQAARVRQQIFRGSWNYCYSQGGASREAGTIAILRVGLSEGSAAAG
jgi:hypothetical protein